MSSVWLKSAPSPVFTALKGDLDCEVCVVGAGVAGMTTAYLLARQGVSVVVLEDGHAGGGETGRSTAHLSNSLDEGYHRLEMEVGSENTRLVAESHSAAIDSIENVIDAENIDCDFERLDGYLICPRGEDRSLLERELKAAVRAGLPVSWAERAPWKSFDTGGCLRFPRQAQFNPVKYLAALASQTSRYGGRLFGGAHVTSALGGKEAVVTTRDGRRVRAQHIVLTTHVPFNDRVVMHTKQAAYRTYAIAVRAPAGLAARALYWDTLDPNHYMRLAQDEGGELFIIGGEDHKTGQGADLEKPYANLEGWARERFPELQNVVHRWSGQIIESIDGLAFIGRNPLDDANVYIATGQCGNGMTNGTIAGLLLSDLIRNRPNPWTELYDPRRRTPLAAGRFIKENFNVLPQYLDWLTAGTAAAVWEIPCGGGEVLREGINKLAVSRDASGCIHASSAVCPHLGGIVHWNADEKSWDCPCHGSRFNAAGEVLNGPANSDLRPLEAPPSPPIRSPARAG